MSSYANEIVPGLWVGSRRVIIAPDSDHSNFDIIISALTEYEYNEFLIDDIDFGSRQMWYRLVIDDYPDEDISQFFHPIAEVIREGLIAGKNILVHCAAGVSRSVSLVAAYLIIALKISASDALKMIRLRRPQAGPNDGFIRQLEALAKYS